MSCTSSIRYREFSCPPSKGASRALQLLSATVLVLFATQLALAQKFVIDFAGGYSPDVAP